jgi:hypothetical protein
VVTRLTVYVLFESFSVLFTRFHLEVKNVSLVQTDLLLVTNVNLFCALRNEAHVMADHDNATFEILQTLGCSDKMKAQNGRTE